MATIKDITGLCKSGKISEAYEMAVRDWNEEPDNPWPQREVGWALYYMIKTDAESGDGESLLEHMGTLQQLDRLTPANDSMIFENILWKVAEYVKDLQADSFGKVSDLFERLKSLTFSPSKPYSLLLQRTLKFEGWTQMADFIEWWNLDNLLQEDYQQFQMTNGKSIMSLAERANIAYSKALLKMLDRSRIEAYIPKLESLTDNHPEMVYPGYFCGKLLVALGSERQEALRHVLPFAKKKASEFWVWQLLSEIYQDDEDKRLALLLRAAHCRTQESFLGKVRIQLANILIRRGDFPRAKFHIDKVSKCYLSQGWHFPFDLQALTNQPWLQTTQADDSDPLDYQSITDEILYGEYQECVAVASFVDQQSKRVSLIYGKTKRIITKFSSWRLRINAGDFLKIKYVPDGDSIRILGVSKSAERPDLDFVRIVSGCIDKRDGNPFAFLKAGTTRCFVSPDLVQKHNLNNGQTVEAVIVYDFNKKKNEWNWSCLSIN